MLVVDASVWLAALDVDDPGHEASRRLVSDPFTSLLALDLSLYEVASVASRWVDPIAVHAAERLVETAAAEIIRVDSGLAARARALAAASRLSAYDAAYVAAARDRGVPLVSLDLRDLVRPGYAVPPDGM